MSFTEGVVEEVPAKRTDDTPCYIQSNDFGLQVAPLLKYEATLTVSVICFTFFFSDAATYEKRAG